MSRSDTWLRRFHQSPDAGVRLVCLPHAGGSASYFFPLSAALSAEIDVLAVQYPGRQDRHDEPVIDDLNRLADQVADALAGLTDLPLAVFGHSFGATLGFEVVRRLERVPVVLFASARRAPSLTRPVEEYVHTRDDDGIVAEVRRLSSEQNAALEDPDLRAMFLPVLRGDYRAIETYRAAPGATVGCPVIVLAGDSDPVTTVDSALAWRGHTTGAFDVRVYSGGHFYLEQHQDAVLRVITETLLSGSARRSA